MATTNNSRNGNGRPRVKYYGKTLDELHTLTGISKNYIGRVMRGQFTPTLSKLIVLAAAVDRPVHRLAHQLNLAPPPPRNPKRLPIIVNRTQTALACGMDVGYVSKIVRGRVKPRLDDLTKLAQHFQTSMDVLIREWEI